MKQILKSEKNILLAILSALPAAVFIASIFVMNNLMSSANYFNYYSFGSEVIPAAVIGFYTIIGVMIAVFSKKIKEFLFYTLLLMLLFWGIYYIIMIFTGSSGIGQLDALFYFLPLMIIVINNGAVILLKSTLAMYRHSQNRKLSRLQIFSLVPCASVVFCIVSAIIVATCISSVEALTSNMFFAIDLLIVPTIKSLNFVLFPVTIVSIISSVAVSIINFKNTKSAGELKKAYLLQTIPHTIVYLIYNVFDLAILDHTYYSYESFYYITDINFYYINIPHVCFYLIPVAFIALNLILLNNKQDKKDADLLQ